ncbi:hypothetical protein [Thiobacter aerophilum]|uniref:Hdr-like menaquinol oxidoreductase cytochrome c subunit n=1 Tax=Thiobacter aerophilum TaxID=3121275 RepID=A0ABV0EG63_9BURK
MMRGPAKLGRRSVWKWAAGLAALLALSLGAVAGGSGDGATMSSRTPKPTLVIEKGERCVEDTAYMRRNHMKLLMHQRDDTVHKGIRTEKHSLQNCINCHASSKNNSVLGTDENFCQSCHSYAAVKLDCWDCHASKPKQQATAPAPALAVGMAATAGGKQ